jgi:hypothetical protein
MAGKFEVAYEVSEERGRVVQVLGYGWWRAGD